MTHMDAIGLGEALLVGGGISVAGAVGGTGLAICGTKFFNKASQFFAEKEAHSRDRYVQSHQS